MGCAQVLSIPNSALSRAQYFRSQHVALDAPARSTSGVRHDDGMVVFAMPAARVRVDTWGCSCLLWTPTDHGSDRAVSMERLRHCRLAVRHGVAEGFLLDRNHAPVERSALLAVRVVRAGQDYWARWGCVSRAEIPGARNDGEAARIR